MKDAKEEIMAYLTAHNIEFDSSKKKEELLSLIQ